MLRQTTIVERPIRIPPIHPNSGHFWLGYLPAYVYTTVRCKARFPIIHQFPGKESTKAQVMPDVYCAAEEVVLGCL